MNIFEVIKFKFPLAGDFDFIVIDENGVSKLSEWFVKDELGNPVPEPTDADLTVWHAEMMTNPKSPEPTLEDRIAAIEETLITSLGLS